MTLPIEHERRGSGPKIEFSIEVSSDALYVEERFLQENELRLHFHFKIGGGTKKRDQQLAKFDLRHLFTKERRAHLANDALKFGNVDMGRDPAAVNVGFGDV